MAYFFRIAFILNTVLLQAFSVANSAVSSQVVGKAGEYFLTSREVEAQFLMEQALMLTDEQMKKASWSLSVEEKEFRRELSGALLEWIVAKEAEFFSIAGVKKDEKLRARQKVTKRLKKMKRWKALRISSKELDRFLSRKLRAKKFIRFKAETSYIDSTDEEALDYFNKNQKRFAGLDFKKYQKTIKERLNRQKRDQRLRDWFETLRKKYKVRSFL